ncbi:MAG: RpiB/LacA/LacB family sugar-phosphate isomerase [Nanoarchaeota archaeon]|nr:RpiB/LacA/LacB family sugar-phosphate isomerase [Nanoarchaeota archaeon]
MSKIYVSGDHAGFELKAIIIKFLEEKGFTVEDYGPSKYDSEDDYPDFVIPMAIKVSASKSRGIVIAGSGQGENIACNKIRGIRSGLYHGGSLKIVNTGRAHNNLNILCFGSRFVTESEAKKAVNLFLKTKFNGGRHLRRLKKVGRILE